MLLAGDIGGTKTTLALYDQATGPRSPLAQSTFRSAEYSGLAEMARRFLGLQDATVERACFGIAGPVLAGRAALTNLAWSDLDEVELADALHIPNVRLINDVEAIAWAVTSLQPADLLALNDAPAEASGSIAVIAPGTGLGEAYLTWDGARYRAHACEGGHADFAPANLQQAGLARFLLGRFEHVSCERVCSGLGLPNIYAFLKESGRFPEPAWLAQRLAGAADLTPIIVQAALAGESSLCQATLDLFVEALGAEAGNLALKILATGGVYVGGGIPPRILPALQSGGFMPAFLNKGRMSRLLAGMPVHVILHAQAALLGAAVCGSGAAEP